ncbi:MULTISPECIES: flagellar basal body rod protein FlgC [Desulfatibacillum]|jgi:flagellar basal-body rod protein FlgC|uniref:Flagellar basal-body rod protein FlgC n=2 Tax=Desulfatibacillum TaxID=218207 RepID=B8FJU2_DESAL|nr:MULTISPECIES: flagellar basal body rod protein FlgC [Desulfatibacillum]ACL02370.1 Flagellar basal-body rod protein FlgC [Desulfatibacillum aliphaticivorans]SHK75859.1 flagellar basal-body rod protein FlgC [Desulfatibacillum alkenivorans DSM 16219]
MDLLNAMHASASALSVSRAQMNVVSENLANANTTRTANGQPYQRKFLVVSPAPVKEHENLSVGEQVVEGVKLVDIVADQSPFPMVYRPEHPDADENGNLQLPNVNVVTEMANMLMAKRVYDSNAAALSTARSMALKALEIGK